MSRFRSLLRAVSPWRRWAFCTKCGVHEPVRQGWVWVCGRCRAYSVTPAWSARRWWRVALPILTLGLGLLLGISARADAQTWTGSVEWRGEQIRLVSTLGPIDSALVLRELDDALRIAQEDLPGVAIPPLGAGREPYVLLVTADPKCRATLVEPKGAQACSGDPPLSRSKLTLARFKGHKALRNVSHEARHRWCWLQRPHVVGGETAAQVLEACQWADHSWSERPFPGGEKGDRYDVVGRPVAVPEKVKPPAPPPPPALPTLNLRQTEILSRFPPSAWARPAEVGATDAICQRMVRKGVLEADGAGRYRRRP